MPVLDFQQDIVPLSEFRSRTASVLEHIQRDEATVILTQNGKAAAALMGIAEYQRLISELAELKSMVDGLADAMQGKTVSHQTVKTRLKKARE
jgi:prevent-host-death family protein